MKKNIYPFSAWLKDALEEAHMPQLELAVQLGIGQGQVSRYVNGQAVPKLENIVRILDVFGKRIEVVDNKSEDEVSDL